MAQEKEQQHPLKIQKRIEAFDLLASKKTTSKAVANSLKITVRQVGRISKVAAFRL